MLIITLIQGRSYKNMHRHNSSIELRQKLSQFLQLNCFGHTRAIKAKDLGYKFNTNIREINAAIRSLRLDGILIGSSKDKPYGYYLPANEDEVKVYLHTYQSELFDMLLIYNRQKRARKVFLENLRNKDLFAYAAAPSGQLAFIP